MKKAQVPARRETVSHSPGGFDRENFLSNLTRELAGNPFAGGRGPHGSVPHHEASDSLGAQTAELPVLKQASKATVVQGSGHSATGSGRSTPELSKPGAKAAKRRHRTMLSTEMPDKPPTKAPSPVLKLSSWGTSTPNTGQAPSLRVSR